MSIRDASGLARGTVLQRTSDKRLALVKKAYITSVLLAVDDEGETELSFNQLRDWEVSED